MSRPEADPARIGAVLVHFGPWSSTRRAVAAFRASQTPVTVLVVNNDPDSPPPDDLGASVIASARNVGYGAACNLGARALRTPLVLFANNDVEPAPGAIAALAAALDRDPRNAAAGPVFTDERGAPRSSLRRAPTPWRILCENLFLPRIFPFVPLFHGHHTTKGNPLRARPVETLLGAFFLVRREAFEEAGGFDEAYFFYAEETDLFARLRARGWKILLEPAARVIHAEGVASEGVDTGTLDRWLHEGLLRYAGSHHGEAGARSSARWLRVGARLRWLLSFAPGPPSRRVRRDRYAGILRFHRERRGGRPA